jgi:hypothetical protein
MYLSGHQYSCPDVFKFSLDLIAGRGHILVLPLPVEGEKHPLGGSEYWGGLEGRAEGRAVEVGLVIYKKLFWSSFPCLFCGLQRM